MLIKHLYSSSGIRPVLAGLGFIAYFVCQQALAQGAIEEIVVSAQKREESLQDVPLHIQAFQPETFENAQVTRVEELVNLSPTLSLSTRRGFDQTSVRIRGVGTQELGSGVEPSVATVIDGVVMARGGSTFNEFPDIERVEILNGPQGTLFGKNASLGLINIVTKRPNHDMAEGGFSARGTSDVDYSGKFGYSAPVNNALAFRVSGFARRYDGNVLNVVNDERVNGVDAFGMRGRLSWDFSDSLNVLFSADFSRQITSCCARVHRRELLSPAASAGRPGTPDIDPSFVNYRGPNLSGGAPSGTAAQVLGPRIRIGPQNDRIAQNFNPFQNSVNRGLSLELNQTLANDFTLTSLTAYREWEAISGWDNDLTAFPFQERQRSDRDVHWFSQELRLTSPLGEDYDYLLGLYYYKAETDATEISDRTVLDTGQDQLFQVKAVSGYDNIAGFGHLNYHPTDRLTVFGGFRLLNDKASATAQWVRCQGSGSRTGTPDFNCATPPASGSASDTKFLYRGGLQYALTDDLNVYGSYSTGYKGRGFSLEYGLDTNRIRNGQEPIAGEESASVEIGLKGTFADSARYSLVLYNTDIEGLQQSLRDLTTIPDANRLGSVKGVTTRGLEASIDAYLSDAVRVGLSYGYNDAFYSDFANANCWLGQTAAQGCINGKIQNRTGQTLEAAPRHRVIFSGRYEGQDSLIAGLRHFAQANYRWRSRANVSSNGDPRGVQDAFGILDLSAGLISADDAWMLSLFIKNVTDQFYIQGMDTNGPDVGGVALHYLPRDYERFVGASLSYQF